MMGIRVLVARHIRLLFGTPPSKALISGKQDPQLVPARKQAPT